MMFRGLAALALIGCSSGGNGPRDAPVLPDAGPSADASATLAPAFRFAIVGDTRPANEDDTVHYPTTVITQIWTDIEQFSPHPDFAVSTGDYIFANPAGKEVAPQLDRYMYARGTFTNIVYPALGNHECTGATASNCGLGTAYGVTSNFAGFMSRMLEPIGVTQPYYTIHFAANDGSWTMKLVFVAANAWNPEQAAWLTTAMAEPTTYTFVIRHEDAQADTAPGVIPSEAIINAQPFTLKIVGHTHTYAHRPAQHEVVCGNGGAPLSSASNYGYAIVERLDDGTIQFTEYDYLSNAIMDQFRFAADGTAVP